MHSQQQRTGILGGGRGGPDLGRGTLIQIDEVPWLSDSGSQRIRNRLHIPQPSVLSEITQHTDHLFICCVWRYVAHKMP